MVTLLLVARARIDALNIQSVTPLMLASQSGYAQMVAVLLGHGASVNLKAGGTTYIKGFSALHFAALRGHSQIAEQLLEAGTDAMPRWRAVTPLMIAAREGNVDTMLALM